MFYARWIDREAMFTLFLPIDVFKLSRSSLFFSDHPHPHLNFISSNEGALRGIATPGFTLDHPWPYQAMGYGRSTVLAHILLYWNTWGTLNWTGCCFLCACGLFIFLYEFFSTPVRRKNRSWTTCGTLVRVNDYSKSCRIFRVHEKCNGRRTSRGVTVITHWYNMGITNRGPINIIFSNCNKIYMEIRIAIFL